MTETSQIEEMKRFLFYEMAERERAALEERFFEDSEYFYDLLELENDLIDSYARGELVGKDLTRFELSLAKSPERREKVAGARAWQTLIAEENPKSAVVVATPGLRERILNFFNFRSPNFQFAAGALAVILLAVAVGFLLYRNSRTNQEYSGTGNSQNEIIEQENYLKQLEEEQRRLEQQRRNEENKRLPENANGSDVPETNTNQPQTEEEERKREIEKLRRKIEDLKQKKNQIPQNPNEKTSSKQYLAVAISSIGRGRDVASVPSAELVTIGGKQKIKITQALPEDKSYASFEIISNGKPVGGSRNIPEGAKSIEFLLQPEIEDFEIIVNEQVNTRGSSESLGTYRLKLTKNK
ncbi:MAG TPA: hypothetical protein VF721_17945 [Pyrinomonadaceae bacterium]|jgi:hypothetical protein